MLYIFGPTAGARSQHDALGSFLTNQECKYEQIYEYKDLFNVNLSVDDCVLCGIPVDDYERNFQVVQFLKDRTPNVFFLMDHWHNSPKNFYDPRSDSYHLPKKIFCIDQHMKQSFIDFGIDEKILEVSGHPALEKTHSDRKELDIPKKLREHVGSDHQIITLFLDPIGDRRNSVGYNEIDVVNLLLAASEKIEKISIAIKPHPRTESSVIKELTKNCKDVFVVEEDFQIDSFDLARISDKVLGMTSIMLIHALVLQKPTLSIQINPTDAGKRRSNPYLDKILCQGIDHIEEFLKGDFNKNEVIPSCIFEGSWDRIYQSLRSK